MSNEEKVSGIAELVEKGKAKGAHTSFEIAEFLGD